MESRRTLQETSVETQLRTDDLFKIIFFFYFYSFIYLLFFFNLGNNETFEPIDAPKAPLRPLDPSALFIGSFF